MAAPPTPESRPLSPHLQVWRWHATMLSSILNRFTGVALVGGLFGLVLWLVALESGAPYFTAASDILRTPLGQGALYLLAVAAMYHLAAGLRHLLWDAGRGFNPKFADITAWMAIVFALVAPLGIWALAKL